MYSPKLPSVLVCWLSPLTAMLLQIAAYKYRYIIGIPVEFVSIVYKFTIALHKIHFHNMEVYIPVTKSVVRQYAEKYFPISLNE